MNPHKASRDQENRRARRSGGTRNAGSGSGWLRKNDVRTATFSFENKITKYRSFTLKLDDLIKAEKIALLDGRTMVFEINMDGRTYMVMTEADWETLIEPIKESPD